MNFFDYDIYNIEGTIYYLILLKIIEYCTGRKIMEATDMDCKDQKLLLLAGVGPHAKVVEAAKEMGVYTIVADYLPTSERTPAKMIADESILCNIYDVETLIEYGKKNKINGVLGFCVDPTQRPAQKIAEALGLPVFGTWNQVMSLTDKKIFKKLCKEMGVDVIPEYREEEIEKGTISYPVVVKPVDSRGSRGTKVCNNKEELLLALPIAKRESSDGGVIIEKYMGNHQDLTISYIVKDGEATLISLGDRYPGKKEDNLDRQLSCTIQPSRYTKMYLEKVNDRVKDMIRHLGIKNGPVFMQGFAGEDTVYMYDPGIRFPGNEYERIYKKATGIDIMKSIISYCVGGEILDYDGKIEGSYDLNGKVAIQYMLNAAQGEITVFDGIDIIKKHPNVVDVQQRYFVGDRIENTGDIKHRVGEISILVERNPEKMQEVIQYIQKTIRIEDTNGKNMIISPIDSAKIKAIYEKGYES